MEKGIEFFYEIISYLIKKRFNLNNKTDFEKNENLKHKKTLSASKIKTNYKNVKSRFLKFYEMENFNSTLISNCNLFN